jgi:hypothetical protein
MTPEQPFKIEGTKVWLSADARALSREYGMSELEMCEHLLEQHRQREAGLIQRDGHDGA